MKDYEDIACSHRPEIGVSIGAFESTPGTMIIAACFVNEAAGDEWNGRVARSILRHRVRDLAENRQRVREDGSRVALDNFVTTIAVPETTDAHEFMQGIRANFKPVPDGSDNTFLTDDGEGGQVRMTADGIWRSIVGIASAVSMASVG